MITFTLPGIPPSVNKYWRHNGNRHHISNDGQAWRETVAYWAPLENLSNKLFCEIALWMPDLRERDIDNPLKSLFDSLQYAKVLQNDNLIRDLHIFEAGIDRDAPRTIVTLGDLSQKKERL